MVFFVFIKKNQDERAKGVLIVTLCIAILTVILKSIDFAVNPLLSKWPFNTADAAGGR